MYRGGLAWRRSSICAADPRGASGVCNLLVFHHLAVCYWLFRRSHHLAAAIFSRAPAAWCHKRSRLLSTTTPVPTAPPAAVDCKTQPGILGTLRPKSILQQVCLDRIAHRTSFRSVGDQGTREGWINGIRGLLQLVHTTDVGHARTRRYYNRAPQSILQSKVHEHANRLPASDSRAS